MSQIHTEPIFISVKEAARMLGLHTWTVYKKLDEQKIESRYDGTRRLVSVASVREYAASLPTTKRPKASA